MLTVILLAAFLPFDLFSTEGIMIALLAAYAGAMWLFLRNTPRIYTVMVSDLQRARAFYEGQLQLSVADVPLQYYADYQQAIGSMSYEPLSAPTSAFVPPSIPKSGPLEQGLWYQLRKGEQLHVVPGANLGERGQQRHVSFDRDALEIVLRYVQRTGLRHKLRGDRPLNFLVKDWENRVIEFAELSS